jgi:hypothetical protein
MLMLMMLFAAGVKWFSALPFAAAQSGVLSQPCQSYPAEKIALKELNGYRKKPRRIKHG